MQLLTNRSKVVPNKTMTWSERIYLPAILAGLKITLVHFFKKKVTVPLLPSMILINISDKDRAQVFTVPGALRYLFWLGKPAIVPSEEVELLNEITTNKQQVLSAEKIGVGQEINLDEFGLSAKKGTVKYVSGNQCWVVLHNLGYVVKLKIG